MSNPDFTGLTAFLSVAKHKSFARAALELGVSRSALSHSIRLLEETLELRLLNRTTRSVALTQAGQRLLARLQPAFADITSALDDLNSLRETPSGVLRVTSPRVATRLILTPLISPFLKAYPQIRLEIIDDDALVDVAQRGFDAGIRFGQRIERDMIAVPFGRPQRLVIVGSPDYFARNPRPAHPDDLRKHVSIRYRFPSGAIYKWQLQQGVNALEVEVDGPLVLNNLDLIAQSAADGLGLAMVFESYAEPFLRNGQLEVVLQDWSTAASRFFLYYPSRRHVPAALRAFIDFVRISTAG